MADELNIPSHRWYQPRNNIKLAPEDTSQKYIYDSGIQKIDAWINSQPWGVGSLFAYAAAGITPQLVADFKTGTYGKAGALSTFDGVLEHSRASSATYVDSSGVLQTAASGVARENHHVYNGSAWVKEGYLHEPEAATNLVTYSQDFTDTSWTKSGFTITANAAVAPDGTTTATRVAYSSSVTVIFYSATVTPLTSYTFSFWVKNNGGLRAEYRVRDVSNATDLVPINTSYFSEIGDVEWTRVSVTVSTPAGCTNLWVYPLASTSVDVTDPVDVFLWGAQLQEGSVLTSYIPTSGSTVTRAADILTLPKENIPYPEPVVIGEELVTNGTFDTDSDWTLSGTAEISSGTAKNLTGGDYIAQGFTTEAGKYYELTFDVLAGTNTANSLVRFGTSANSFSISNSSVGAIGTGLIRRFLATGSVTWVTFFQANFTSEYDNISVREINPLAVSFGYKALVTYADTGATNVIWYDWRLNSANYLQANLRTQSTATGEVYALQAASGVTDDVDGRFSQYSPGINVPMSLASRHGSTFINVAVDGVALTADTTPTAFPDLSATDLVIAPSGGPQVIQEFIMWGEDIGDTGIEEASA